MVEPVDVVRQVHKHVARTGGAALQGLGAVSGANRVRVSGISQDNIIFAAVLFSFIIWITSKGELPRYISFFNPSGTKQGPPVSSFTASSTTGTTPAQAAANQSNATVAGQVGAALGNATGATGLANTGIGSAIRGFLTSPGATTSLPGGIWSWLTTGQWPSFSNK